MLEMEELLMIRDLHARGMNIKQISKKTGYDRKTIRTHLKSTSIPEQQKRPGKASKLDNYRDYITAKLHEGPYTASRLYREIQEMGFTGKYTIVKDFVRKVRPEQGVTAVYRYETKPGVQAQVDWSEVGKIEIDGKTKKLHCFNMVLGYSRMKYIEFTLTIDVITLIKCHLNAFHYFGGVTKEILYDNMKQVVIRRALKSSDSTWHSKFEDFFRYYGFTPRLCRPYRAQTKGKIENIVGYVKRDLVLGIEASSLQDLNNQSKRWLERVNSSVHGTTHEIPLERHKHEGLQPIDTVPEYFLVLEEKRKISRDCFISYLGNKYSVPYRFAGREAILHIRDDGFKVFVAGEQVCEHELLPGSGRVSRKKEHFSGLLKDILKENIAVMNKKQCTCALNFSEPDVEKRSLSVYEAFSRGV
jgi:transposase